VEMAHLPYPKASANSAFPFSKAFSKGNPLPPVASEMPSELQNDDTPGLQAGGRKFRRNRTAQGLDGPTGS
jgi:hypothetical protein